MTTRAQQKERTRQALMNAALQQLGPDRNFASLSLREVAREAGIAPTSFYRHFNDLEELGLALVDEAGITLRRLMRQARKRVAKKGGLVETSIDTFFEYLNSNANLFRLLLREKSGVSLRFRTAIKAETDHFITELAADLGRFGENGGAPLRDPKAVADALVVLVFNCGSEGLDADAAERKQLKLKLSTQLRMVLRGGLVQERKPGAAKTSDPGG
ncbi:HTH-type transcriptional repressor FabR [Hahella sp. CR1]|uniref:HTH-type transcriptional repressor FabR n=1 Tax=Hahella sp. CR1 TaxID=2992807 RepID=UPI0032607568